jgi:hypothetical protein
VRSLASHQPYLLDVFCASKASQAPTRFQEALKRPLKQKRKLRIFISNTAFPANEAAAAKDPAAPPPAAEGSTSTCWELRVEGRLIDEDKKVGIAAHLLKDLYT